MKKNLYYSLWVTFIKNQLRKYGDDERKWKFDLLLLVSHFFGLGLWTILIWLKYFNVFTFKQVEFPVGGSDYLTGALSFLVQYTLIFITINYFLIFHRKRYLKLITRYEPMGKIGGLIFIIGFAGGAFLSFAIITLLSD